ncbi:ATP-binding protein [Planctomycetota bacterium]
MSLKEIFCQDKPIDILQRSFAVDRSAHAYIFAGLQGIGKFKTACEWARMLLCKETVTENGFTDSCGLCESCQLIEGNSHPDFIHVYKELREFTKNGKGKAAPIDMPIDVIREFLIVQAPSKPKMSPRKVFVVSEAEKLNAASQNALLKILEEPPEYCTIILLCTRLEKLLATTKSRCRIIRFSPIDTDRIIDKLSQIGLENTQAKYFARLAQGSIGQGCQWAKLELAGADLYQTKTDIIQSLSKCRYADSVDMAQRLLDQSKKIALNWAKIEQDTSKADINRRALKTIVQIVISTLHDAMKLSVTEDTEIINFDQKEQIEQLAKLFGAELSAEKITHAYKAMRWIEANVNEKLIFEHLLLNFNISGNI